MITRRTLLSGMGSAAMLAQLPTRAWATSPAKPLQMPPLVDATNSGRFALTAQAGQMDFLGRGASKTWGFDQPFLGPTLRLHHQSETAAEVSNALDEAISVHWHGLVVPGDVDGGPHQLVQPGQTWSPVLPVDQPPATVWYHSHTHGMTARQVQMGLAGVLHLTDGQDDARGLPTDYGVDDLTLVLQDRRFDQEGRMSYDLSMPDQMMGFLGDTMLVNGQVGATAVVPKGVVRLRLLNGSNARIYTLTLSDSRPMHLVGTDAGLLDRPIALDELTLAPGERYEVLVDFGAGQDVSLLSGQNINEGMMGGMMGGRGPSGPPFEVLPFAVDSAAPVRMTRVPDSLGGSRPKMDASNAAERHITLDMAMGPGMMMRRAENRFSINGEAFDMTKINFSTQVGQVEKWTVSANMMMHPFHVHGVMFQVLSENGQAPAPQNTGWKDTILINGQAEILMRFTRPAAEALPYMFHCHILEHEDGGMMGQFSVVA
ncbi:cell division protein SufI [Lentibacter algarum]|jgi:FtsP/CotA-like multicopper oxidase with cupredoxin domain|uniref:Multicopper oxidase CueO n=1 Tax=Lentibacter algarum TaxID=576131 RepID=A0A1H3NB39_9RHOB|nr:multicopper oxidase domain-containing protein [Lentibacter algarum]SDY85880.1 cell division protein SufI [Lentibacter algarum]